MSAAATPRLREPNWRATEKRHSALIRGVADQGGTGCIGGGLSGRPLQCAKPFARGAMMRGAEFGAQVVAAKIARGDKR